MQATEGKLFYYYKDPYCKVPIFMSGKASRCVLWIGGQTESFFTICYFEELAKALDEKWNFAQMELPSGHIGYGAQDHFCEAEDVDEIIGMLHNTYGMKEIALFATSTGVQVALQLLTSGHNVEYITRVIMHGIVCPPDNEFFTLQGIARRQERVEALMKEGRKEDSLAMVGYYDIPVTPSRVSGGGFLSLQEALWQPALLDQAEVCHEALKRISVPTLIMIANDSHYKPTEEDLSKVRKMAQASVHPSAVEDLRIEVFRDTCDEIRRLLKADISAHVGKITQFLNDADAKRAEEEAKARAIAEEEERQKRFAFNKLVCS